MKLHLMISRNYESRLDPILFFQTYIVWVVSVVGAALLTFLVNYYLNQGFSEIQGKVVVERSIPGWLARCNLSKMLEAEVIPVRIVTNRTVRWCVAK